MKTGFFFFLPILAATLACRGQIAAAGGQVAETVAFDDLPLPDALRQLGKLAGLNIQFDPRLVNRQDANHHPIPSPSVNEKMKNVTPRQAMQALLDEFGYRATGITGNPILRIEAKDAKTPDASASPARPR